MVKLSQDYIESLVEGELYFNTGKTTICVLKLRNSYEVVGVSATVDVKNFDIEIGKRIAKESAVREIWALEGYLQQQAMHQHAPTPEAPLLVLKWGGVKSTNFNGHPDEERALQLLEELDWLEEDGNQADKQKRLQLLDRIIDLAGDMEIYIHWEGKFVTCKEAKQYVREYGNTKD